MKPRRKRALKRLVIYVFVLTLAGLIGLGYAIDTLMEGVEEER